jgi:hypothetical protein
MKIILINKNQNGQIEYTLQCINTSACIASNPMQYKFTIPDPTYNKTPVQVLAGIPSTLLMPVAASGHTFTMDTSTSPPTLTSITILGGDDAANKFKSVP